MRQGARSLPQTSAHKTGEGLSDENIRLFYIIFLALTTAVLLFQPAAALPIVDPIPPKCQVMNSSDVQQVERIDIPSHWGNYAILGGLGNARWFQNRSCRLRGFHQCSDLPILFSEVIQTGPYPRPKPG